MRCPKCLSENPDDTLFCGKCGTQIRKPEDGAPAVTMTFQAPLKELTTGSTFAGRYQVIEELGKGGMGKVYKVLDKDIEEKVALKLLKPEIASDEETIRRFRNEIKFARKITHKNVCRMYDLGKAEGTHYITMEFVEGEDLKSTIRRIGQLPLAKSVAISKQICEGLTEAHRLGVVHRDLKPQNIMIDKEGNARIMDFGIARSLKAEGITGEGMMIGTPEYMSPEQVEGKESDQRSDIYALGVILYEMLTGKVPFEGGTALSIALKHKTETPPNPRVINAQIPDDLGRIVLRCLEKDKAKRYQTADELRSELANSEKYLSTTTMVVPRTELKTEAHRMPLKKFVLPGAILLIAVIAILTYFLLIRAPSKEKVRPTPTPENEWKNSMAVLPFRDFSPQKDQEQFCFGMTDAIINKVSQIGELKVISTTSVMRYKDANKDIKEIGKELGVANILEGSVQKEADRIRLIVQLINAENGFHLWSQTYNPETVSIFDIQSDVSRQIANALDAVLSPTQKARFAKKPTENLEAYAFYNRGIDYERRGFTEEHFSLAEEMYKKAVELDPNFALAYANISRMHAMLYWFGYDRAPDRLIRAKEALEKASKLDPDLPEVHLAQGDYYYRCLMDYKAALEQYSIAQQGLPNNSELLASIGYIQRRQGKFEDAIKNQKRAYELDPNDAEIVFELGNTCYCTRRYADAEKYYQTAILKAPDMGEYAAMLAGVYINGYGDTKKARGVLEKIPEKKGPILIYTWIKLDFADRKYQEAIDRLNSLDIESVDYQLYSYPRSLYIALAYYHIGNKEKAKINFEAAQTFLVQKFKERPQDVRLYSSLGLALAGLGRKEEAIQSGIKGVSMLPVSKEAIAGAWRVGELTEIYTLVGEYDKAIDQIQYLLSIPSLFSVQMLKLDPIWDPLRNNPRFIKLLKQLTKHTVSGVGPQ